MIKKLRTLSGGDLHPEVPKLCARLAEGRVDRREFLRTAALLGVTTASAAAVAGLPLGRSARAAETPKAGGVLRYSMAIQEITDPALASWIEASNLYRNSLEYLTEVGADNVARPYLAESWEPNEDLTRWRFTLRRDVTWSNGDPFTTDDVAFNFERWLAEDSQSSIKSLLSPIRRFEKVDDHTFVLHLDKPLLALPESLYQYPAAIVHRDFEKMGGNWSKNPIGTGPFLLDQYRVGEIATFKRRPDYWGEPALLDEIRYIDLGENIQAHVAALASDQVDLIYRVSVAELELVRRLPDVTVFNSRVAQTGIIRMQVDQKPFDDIRVRKAIVLAADNEQMLALAYRGQGVIAEDHHVAPFQPEYFQLPPRARDVEQAKALLAEAGYGPDNPLRLELTVGNTQGQWEQDCCVVFRNNCAEAGIDVALNVLPSAQYWPIWDKAPFSLTYWAHRPLAVMTHQLAYRAGAPWNETHFNDPAYDAALDKAVGIADPVERSKAMEDVERILQDACIMVQPFWADLFTAGSTRVRDFTLHPAQYQRMDKVWLEA